MSSDKEVKPKFKESDAGDGTVREDHYLHGAKLILCTISILLCLFLVALDQLIIASTLTTVLERFRAFKMMNWLMAAYLIPMGGCSQTWGRFSISFGRKSVMLTAMVLFEIGSLIAAVAQDINVFIVGRTIQGIGASGVQTLAVVLITEISTADKRPFLLGSVAVVFVLASVLGPVVGGIFTTYVSWRWSFYINLCLGAVVFPLFIFTYKTRPPVAPLKQRLKTIDFFDNFLLIASIVLLCLGISFGETDGWRAASTITSFVIGGVLGIVFLVYNFKFSKYPAIPLDIVRVPSMVPTMLNFALCYSSALVILQFLAIYFQIVANHDAFHSGLSLLPTAIPMPGFSVLAAFIIRFTRYIKPISLVSAVLVPVGCGLQVLLPLHENMGYSIGFQVLLGSSVGLGFQGPLNSALIVAPKSPGSTILTTAFFNTGRSVVCAVFSLISGVIFNATLQSGLREILPQLHARNIPFDSVTANVGLIGQLDAHDRELVLGKVLVGIHNAFWLAVGMAIFSCVMAIFMSNARLPKIEDIEGAKREDPESA